MCGSVGTLPETMGYSDLARFSSFCGVAVGVLDNLRVGPGMFCSFGSLVGLFVSRLFSRVLNP